MNTAPGSLDDKAPPPSASSFVINLAGGVCYIIAIILIRQYAPDMEFVWAAVLSLLAGAVPVLLGEWFILRVGERPRAALLPAAAPFDAARVQIKITGYVMTLILMAAGYFCLQGLGGGFYTPFVTLVPVLALIFLVGGLIYIAAIDRYLPQPCDSLYHFGLVVCGRGREADMADVALFMRSVLLRFYFLPVMYVHFAIYGTQALQGDALSVAMNIGQIPSGAPVPQTTFFEFLLMAYLVFAAMDVLFATIGYLVTFRPLDTDIRSVDESYTGWIVCIICYFPFWDILLAGHIIREFNTNPAWFVWFADNAVLLSVWGTLVVLAMLAESITTMSFGLRFSNLTYRGLISAGPFRLTKHPQYITKLCNRYLFYVPFMAAGGVTAALLLHAQFAVIVLIYYLRARTEENHLSRYPEYVEYAHWIDRHGLFRFMGRIHPRFKFDEQRARAGKLFPVF